MRLPLVTHGMRRHPYHSVSTALTRTRQCLIVGGILGVLFARSLVAQPKIPIQEVRVVAESPTTFGRLQVVYETSPHHLVVHDPASRRVLLLDSSLVTVRAIFDSSGSGSTAYGGRATRLIRSNGDTLLFVDAAATALVVLDPDGRPVRSLAGPSSRADFLGLTVAASYIDADGNLVFRRLSTPRPHPIVDPRTRETTLVNALPDSVALLRFRFDSRLLDTLALVRQPSTIRTSLVNSATGGRTLRVALNPVGQLDDWAVLSDGTLMIVRGHDYHAEVFPSQEARFHGTRLPIAWRPLSESDKTALADSTRAVWRELERRALERGGPSAAMAELQQALIVAFDPTAPVSAGPAPSSGRTSENRPGAGFVVEPVPIDEMPDFLPPFRRDAVLPDRDGNLWILPTTSIDAQRGQLTYDVVSNRGILSCRVRVPQGRLVVGFGRHGAVYLASLADGGRWRLERALLAETATKK